MTTAFIIIGAVLIAAALCALAALVLACWNGCSAASIGKWNAGAGVIVGGGTEMGRGTKGVE